jgi:hypothetical protein
MLSRETGSLLRCVAEAVDTRSELAIAECVARMHEANNIAFFAGVWFGRNTDGYWTESSPLDLLMPVIRKLLDVTDRVEHEISVEVADADKRNTKAGISSVRPLESCDSVSALRAS